jgi:cobalt transporter subunit CbtB
MRPMSNSIESSVAIPASGSTIAWITARMPAIAVLSLGLVMLYSLGFSTTTAAHNATHDTRHANGFPCH